MTISHMERRRIIREVKPGAEAVITWVGRTAEKWSASKLFRLESEGLVAVDFKSNTGRRFRATAPMKGKEG